MLAIQDNGENIKIKNAFSFFDIKNKKPIKKIQDTFTNFTMVRVGQNLKKIEIIEG